MDSSLPSTDQTNPSRQSLATFNESSSASQPQLGLPSHQKRNHVNQHDGLTKALGWFSVGLGVVELLAPRTISRMTGLHSRPLLIRALGLREITSGVGILSNRNPSPWLWSRVAGDAMDLAILGSATQSIRPRRKRAAIAAAAVAGVTALDLISSIQHGKPEGGLMAGTVDVEKFITINRSPDECYQFWRNFENFPQFMKHLEQVQILDGKRSHWKAKAPAGASVEWDAELSVDEPGRLLAWRSLEGADIDNAGTVTFERATGGRGTIVRVQMQYKPPAGKAGALIAKLFGEEPARQIDEDLRRFKQLIETGEVTTTVGQPSGPRSAFVRLLHKGVQK